MNKYDIIAIIAIMIVIIATRRKIVNIFLLDTCRYVSCYMNITMILTLLKIEMSFLFFFLFLHIFLRER